MARKPAPTATSIGKQETASDTLEIPVALPPLTPEAKEAVIQATTKAAQGGNTSGSSLDNPYDPVALHKGMILLNERLTQTEERLRRVTVDFAEYRTDTAIEIDHLRIRIDGLLATTSIETTLEARLDPENDRILQIEQALRSMSEKLNALNDTTAAY